MKTITFLATILLINCVSTRGSSTNNPRTLEELNEWYVEPAAGSNAATYYLQAFAAFNFTNADYDSVHLPVVGKAAMPALDNPVPAAMKSAIAAFVRRNQQAIDLLKRGTELEQCRYPINLTNGYWTKLPHLARVKQSTLLLELSALLDASNRDGRKAGQSILSSLAVAQSLESEPILVSQLVRIACIAISVSSLEQVLRACHALWLKSGLMSEMT
jgi:hypothetical protein